MMAPEIVYHYTDSKGLIGIVSKCQLWMGDVEFMNDAQELSFSRKNIVDDLKIRADALFPEDAEYDDSPNANRAGMLRSVVNYLMNIGTPDGYHVYAACFCENGDLLSQWRGYAGRGGFAIGFKTAALRRIDTELLESPVRKVRYGLKQAQDVRSSVLCDIAAHPKGHPGVQAWNDFHHRVLPLVATIKHPSFIEEQEWRLLDVRPDLHDDVLFRATTNGPVPYRTVTFSKDAIASITAGPGYHPKLREAGVRQLLSRHELEGVTVSASTSPLRP